MSHIKFQLVTLLGKKVDAEVYGVTLTTADGEISVYGGHEPLVSLALPGVIAVRSSATDSDEDLEFYATSGGIIEINPKRIRVLVDEAEASADIIEGEVQAALQRAITMRKAAGEQIELERAQKLIDRHQVRLKVAGLRRHKRK